MALGSHLQRTERTVASPDMQVEMDSSSIFGGTTEKKDDSRQLPAAEGRDRGAMMASTPGHSGAGDPNSATTTVPATAGSSEKLIEVDETPVDR